MEELPSPDVLAPDASFVWVRSPPGGDQQGNQVEARFVANLVQRVVQNGVSANEVAVVTPFRRQAALIRSLLQAHLPQGATLPIIGTVERVQGLTVELVVVSVCVSDPEYARARATFLFSPNRLNVALSRARTKAVLVAAPGVLAIAAPDSRTRIASASGINSWVGRAVCLINATQNQDRANGTRDSSIEPACSRGCVACV